METSQGLPVICKLMIGTFDRYLLSLPTVNPWHLKEGQDPYGNLTTHLGSLGPLPELKLV